PNEVAEALGEEPVGVVHHLDRAVRLVAPNDLERLLEVGLRVGVDLLLGELRARLVAPRRVAEHRRRPADDEDRVVAEVLELAQLAQHHGVAEVQVGRGRIEAELDAQRLPARDRLREALRELLPLLAVDHAVQEQPRLPLDLGRRRVAHRPPPSTPRPKRIPSSDSHQPRQRSTSPPKRLPVSHSSATKRARLALASGPGSDRISRATTSATPACAVRSAAPITSSGSSASARSSSAPPSSAPSATRGGAKRRSTGAQVSATTRSGSPSNWIASGWSSTLTVI